LAVALLRLRAAGPRPKNSLPTPVVNEADKDDLARPRAGMGVLTQMTGEG